MHHMTCVNSRVLYNVNMLTQADLHRAECNAQATSTLVSLLLHIVQQRPDDWKKMAWCCEADKSNASLKIRYVIVVLVRLPAGMQHVRSAGN